MSLASKSNPMAPFSSPGSWILSAALPCIVLVLAAAAAIAQNYPALLLLAAIPFLPVIVFGGAQALSWRGRSAVFASAFVIVCECAVFRIREIEDKSIDAQIALKLACLTLMTMMVVAAFASNRISLGRGVDLRLRVAFIAYLLLTTLISVRPLESAIEMLSNIVGALFLYSFSRTFGPEALVRLLIATCMILCIASIAAYFGDPQLGRMSDWVGNAYVQTSRLQGVFGTANAAGATAGIGLLLTAIHAREHKVKFVYLIVAPMLFCLLMSNNRMALAAFAIGWALTRSSSRNIKLKLALLLFAVALAIILFLIFGDAILEALSRSGSADEITSGTGRTRIWSVVIDLWKDRPFFGYGPGSAKYILPQHPLLFRAAAHAHNLYLNILFAGGIVGLTIFVVTIFNVLKRCWRSKSYDVIGLLCFFLVYGMTEPTLSGMVSFVSLGFYAAVILSSSSRLNGVSASRRWFSGAEEACGEAAAKN